MSSPFPSHPYIYPQNTPYPQKEGINKKWYVKSKNPSHPIFYPRIEKQKFKKELRDAGV
jgi:hypothetical protein